MKQQRNNVARNVVKRLLPLCLFTFLPQMLYAQTFTQNLQKQVKGEGVITLHQDKDIEDLVNGPQPVKPATTTETEKNDDSKQPAHSTTATATQQDSLVKNHSVTRVTGYRVQVYAGGNSRADKQKAEQIGSQLKSLFPAQQVYVHFYSPRWICRIGNFTSREDAEQLKNELREMGFDQTTIVKGKITLQE